MRRLLQVGALAAAIALLPLQQAEAQVGFGAQASYDFAGDGSFGAGARVDVGLPALPIGLLGTFDYFFADPDDYWQIGANAIFDIPLPAMPVSPYVGGGLNYMDFEGGDDTGWQILGGVEFGLPGMINPFAELKVVDHFDTELQISVGVNF